MNYWVLSPNVLNNKNLLNNFLEIINKEHIALMGYNKEDNSGVPFNSSIKKGDIIIISKGANNNKKNYFAGIVNSDSYKYKFNGRDLQARKLKYFTDISNKNISWNNNCAYGEARMIPALYELKSDNPNDKKVIDEVLYYINSGGKMTEYIELLKSNKNLILTGAPGTGKTYLAKEIAKEMTKIELPKNPNDIIKEYYKKNKEDLEKYYNECEILREEFIKKFPKEELKSISMDDYCIGDGNKNSFCYWIERKLDKLGKFWPRGAGTYLLYRGKNGDLKNTSNINNNNELIEKIREAIYKMATKEKYNEDFKFKSLTTPFAMKIYNSYNGYEYFPIFAKSYMDKLCEIFNIEKAKNPYEQNLEIKKYFDNNFKDIKPVIIKEILIRNFDLKNDSDIIKKDNDKISLVR